MSRHLLPRPSMMNSSSSYETTKRKAGLLTDLSACGQTFSNPNSLSRTWTHCFPGDISWNSGKTLELYTKIVTSPSCTQDTPFFSYWFCVRQTSCSHSLSFKRTTMMSTVCRVKAPDDGEGTKCYLCGTSQRRQ